MSFLYVSQNGQIAQALYNFFFFTDFVLREDTIGGAYCSTAGCKLAMCWGKEQLVPSIVLHRRGLICT